MITIEKPHGYLPKEVKERIIFLLCLANFGGIVKERISDKRMWKRFRKGQFAFSRYEYFHVQVLNDVTWFLIFKFYMARPKRIIRPRSPVPYHWRDSYDDDDMIADLNAYADDDDMGCLEYIDDYADYLEYTGAWHPIFSFYGDTLNLKHYGYEDEEEDSIKEVNQELWGRKKRRHDHTPKRRWKQKFRRRKETAQWKNEI